MFATGAEQDFGNVTPAHSSPKASIACRMGVFVREGTKKEHLSPLQKDRFFFFLYLAQKNVYFSGRKQLLFFSISHGGHE